MPDWLNPIFVLRTRRWFTLLWRYRWFLSGGYLSFYCFWLFFFEHDIWNSEWANALEIVIVVGYILVAVFSFGLGVMPISQLPKRYIDGDLIHYTALSDKQVLFGYIYVGAFYSGVVCLCGTLVHLLLLPALGLSGLISLGYFFSLFLISQMLSLFSASFFAGVRKQYEFILMGLAMYITCFILFGTMISPFISSLLHRFAFWTLTYWLTVVLCVPVVSICAYQLILWNLERKTFLLWKMFRTVFVYTILAVGLYLTWFLWTVTVW